MRAVVRWPLALVCAAAAMARVCAGWVLPVCPRGMLLPRLAPSRGYVPGRAVHVWARTSPKSGGKIPGLTSRADVGMGFGLQWWQPAQVVTDIDDTVKSSGNRRLGGIPLGGIDSQYAYGEFYPGVFQFGLELARHRLPPWESPLPMAVLTARAREFLFALELNDRHPVSVGYTSCGARNGVPGWGLGTVLYGSVKEWVCQERKGWRKFNNFCELVRQDNRSGRFGLRCGYLFIGDTGEGDTEAAERMCMEHPGRLRAVFLHAVSDRQGPARPLVPQDRLVAGVPILYFRTYVGAATKAVEHGLMDRGGLQRVSRAAKQALADTPRDSSKWHDLLADLKAARRLRSLPMLDVDALSRAWNGDQASAGKGPARSRVAGPPLRALVPVRGS